MIKCGEMDYERPKHANSKSYTFRMKDYIERFSEERTKKKNSLAKKSG
jgi:hypothetical protein